MDTLDIYHSDCPICGKHTQHVFTATILYKYNVKYFCCLNCGLLKTEKPYWLHEAYNEAIADTDTGILSRNITNSKQILPLLFYFKSFNDKVLDVSGGYGIFARLLRDKGIDCYSTDKYCKNLFAKHFEPKAGLDFKTIFLFEVLEHIENPVSFLKETIGKYHPETIIFSTDLFDLKIPDKTWWFYSFDTGQHITFYQQKTLDCLASNLNMVYYRINNSLHVFSTKKVSSLKVIMFQNKYLLFFMRILVNCFQRKKSLNFRDHLFVKQLNSKKIG